MRLTDIEIVVGERIEAPEPRRRLRCLAAFRNDSGELCRSCVHEMGIPERALCDPDCIARIVAHVVRGLISEFAGSKPDRVEEADGIIPSL